MSTEERKAAQSQMASFIAHSHDGLLHNDQPDTHHWTPKREGRLGKEWTFIQHCEACGAQYRNGLVVWL